MTKISHDQIIGVDVSRDWLEVHCLPEGQRQRLANTKREYDRRAGRVFPHEKPGSTDMFDAMDAELKDLLHCQIAGLELQIEQTVCSDDALAETADILRSVPGNGPVASIMLIAEMPELGQISGEQATALTGLAPIAQDSGAMRGKRLCRRTGVC